MMRTTDWRVRTVAAIVTAVLALMCAPVPARAHDGVASSTPRAGSTIEEPITEVTIEFLGEVADDFQLTLLDPDENPLASTTTRVSPTTAKIEFERLTRKGTYIVRYVAQIRSDDHLTIGAISFDYGSSGSGIGVGTWIFMAVVSAVILAIGVGFSVRRHRQLAADTAT